MTADEEWARHLLAALPQPRIPDEVRTRLDTAIAKESERVAHEGSPAAPLAVVPHQQSRRRRPVLTGLIGVAAALTLFAVVDPLGTSGHDQSDSTIAGEADVESDRSENPNPAPTAAGESDASTAVVLATQTAYNRAELGAQARQTVERATSEGLPVSPASPTPEPTAPPNSASGGSPSVTLNSAEACAAAIPEPKGSLVFIDRADFEGEPALIVAFRSDDLLDVVIQHPSCTRSDPAVAYRVTVEAPRAGGE